MLLAELHAENISLNHEVKSTKETLEFERSVLTRMMEVDPTLPVSLLVSLLSISRRKRGELDALRALEQDEAAGAFRVSSVKSCESWLMTAACASEGPTFFGHSRRWASLQAERTAAERDLDMLSRQVSMMRERVAKLEALEGQTWGTVTSNASRTASRRGFASRPSSQQSNATAKPMASRTMVSRSSLHPPVSKIPTRVGRSSTSPSSSPPRAKASSSVPKSWPSPPKTSPSLQKIPPPPKTSPPPRTSPPPTKTSPSHPVPPTDMPEILDTPSPAPVKPTLPRASISDIPFSKLVVLINSRLPVASPPRSNPSSPKTTTFSTPPSAPPKLVARSTASSTTLYSPMSPSSGTETLLGPATPRSSRFDASETPGRTSLSNELKPPKAPRPMSWASFMGPAKESVAVGGPPPRPPRRGHERHGSAPFDITSSSIAPVVTAIDPARNGVSASPSFRRLLSADTPPLSSSAKKAQDTAGANNRSEGPSSFKKLVSRGLFRPASRSSANGAPTPSRIARLVVPQTSSSPSVLSGSKLGDQRIEPILKNWVQEQADLPPRPPSARERADYYGDSAKDGRVKPRRPFSALLRPSRGGWLGSSK